MSGALCEPGGIAPTLAEGLIFRWTTASPRAAELKPRRLHGLHLLMDRLLRTLSHRLERPAPRGNVWLLVLPCRVTRTPVPRQHSLFLPVCSKVGPSVPVRTRDSTAVVLEEAKPSARASDLHFQVFYKHAKGWAPTRLDTAISNSNAAKVSVFYPGVCLSMPLCPCGC